MDDDLGFEKLNKLVEPLDLLLLYFPQVQLLLSIPQLGQKIESDIKNILVMYNINN